LQNRGLKDIFIACCDGLTGFPDAIEAVFPKTQVQLCIVHMVRNSLSYVSYKDRKAVAADLKLIYTASTEAQAEQQLVAFAEKWDKSYPTISKSWLNPLLSNWVETLIFRRLKQCKFVKFSESDERGLITGSTSFHFLPFRQKFAKPSTPLMRLNHST
jgi:transposase-like protein